MKRSDVLNAFTALLILTAALAGPRSGALIAQSQESVTETQEERFLRVQCEFLTNPDARVRLGAREALRPLGADGVAAVRALAARTRDAKLRAFLDRTIASLKRGNDKNTNAPSSGDLDSFAARAELSLAQIAELEAVLAEVERLRRSVDALIEAIHEDEDPSERAPLKQKWLLDERLARFLTPARVAMTKTWLRENLAAFSLRVRSAKPQGDDWIKQTLAGSFAREALWRALTIRQPTPPTDAELAAAPRVRLTYRIPPSTDGDFFATCGTIQRALLRAGFQTWGSSKNDGNREFSVTVITLDKDEAERAKALVAGLTSARFAISATDAELRDPKTGIAPDFDAERFIGAKRSTPTLLFANPADPTKPTSPKQKPRFAYCPAARYRVRGRMHGPERGAIVHLSPDRSMSARHIENAEPQAGPFETVVTFKLTKKAAPRFTRMTRENKGRRLCIIVDERVVSDPVINAELPGEGVIEGVGDLDTTNRIVTALRAGLDVTPVLVREERLPAQK